VQSKADTSRSQRSSITEDPTAWVLETYPWPVPTPTPLMRLKPDCDDSQDNHNCSPSASNKSLQSAPSSSSEDQLVSLNVTTLVCVFLSPCVALCILLIQT